MWLRSSRGSPIVAEPSYGDQISSIPCILLESFVGQYYVWRDNVVTKVKKYTVAPTNKRKNVVPVLVNRYAIQHKGHFSCTT